MSDTLYCEGDKTCEGSEIIDICKANPDKSISFYEGFHWTCGQYIAEDSKWWFLIYECCDECGQDYEQFNTIEEFEEALHDLDWKWTYEIKEIEVQ